MGMCNRCSLGRHRKQARKNKAQIVIKLAQRGGYDLYETKDGETVRIIGWMMALPEKCVCHE